LNPHRERTLSDGAYLFPSLSRIFFGRHRFNENGPLILFLIFGVKTLFREYHNILWYIFLDTQDIFLYIVLKFVPKYQRFETTKKKEGIHGQVFNKMP